VTTGVTASATTGVATPAAATEIKLTTLHATRGKNFWSLRPVTADDIREAGRLCAGFDRMIIKEDIDRRGRARGEIAQLLTEGLIEGGMDPSRIEVLYEEGEAVNRGLDLLGEDDLLVIHADKVPGTLAIVRERAVQAT